MNDAAHMALTVNGQDATVEGADGALLIFALREQLGLRGVRPGCAVGECGACTVLVDGAPVRSCITTLGEVAGTAVTTPEGLGGPDAPHPIQQAFIDAQAAQCGYCVNGIIMATAALAADAEPMSRQHVAEALDATLCRCGTHARVLQAVCRALGVDPGAGDGDTGLCDGISACRTVRCSEAEPPPAVEVPPPEVQAAPNVESWLHIGPDGRVVLSSGRSEVGQGVHAALRQVAAAQLGTDVDLVVVRTPRTDESPDEGYTSGSRSMQQGAVAVAMAAAGLRRLLLDRAEAVLRTPADGLTVAPDGFVVDGAGRRVGFAELVEHGALRGEISLDDQPRWTGAALGLPTPRADLPAKVTGSPAYVHDLDFPGMLHARLVLPPTYDAQLTEVDPSGVEAMPGVERVIVDGRLLLVLAAREEQAVRAAVALEARARWDDPGLAFNGSAIETLRGLPAQRTAERQDPDVETALAARTSHRASYSKPYHSHGSMAPSAAVAHLDDGQLTVWSHTQGVYPLRKELAAITGLDDERLTVVQRHGPGCYGQNAADDAAAFAAYAAQQAPARPVRLMLSSADEFGWEPYGSAMACDIEASLDGTGRIAGWRHRIITDTHTARPAGQGDRLAVSWLRADGAERPWLGPSRGGTRNSLPIYDFPAIGTVADQVEGPLRTGPLRSLGAFFNIFAIESFMDELAEAAGEDPLAFRLAHLRDPRARELLEIIADVAGWRPRVGPSGRGQGLGLNRYHDVFAYVAVVADVDVDLETDHVTVERLVIAGDAGTVVHAEQLRQQLEGAALQALSRTIHERLPADAWGVHARDWSSYPVLRFTEVPKLEVIVLDRPGTPPLGAGEASTGPVAPAVANAIDDAVGIRLRDLPLTDQAVRARLLDMTDEELDRVRAD